MISRVWCRCYFGEKFKRSRYWGSLLGDEDRRHQAVKRVILEYLPHKLEIQATITVSRWTGI